MDVPLKALHALRVDWNVGKDHILHNPHTHYLLEAYLKVVPGLEDVVVAEDEPLLAVKPLYDGKMGLLHGYVPEVVNLVLRRDYRVPALNYGLVKVVYVPEAGTH